jgi:hypothetical protein
MISYRWFLLGCEHIYVDVCMWYAVSLPIHACTVHVCTVGEKPALFLLDVDEQGVIVDAIKFKDIRSWTSPLKLSDKIGNSFLGPMHCDINMIL